MKFTAAVAPRPRLAALHEPDKDTRDAVANLGAWLTDTHHRTSTTFGAEALAVVKKALIDGDDTYTRGAYLLVCKLRDRNGQDVPAGHSGCGGDFRGVLETLQDALIGKMEARGRGR